MRGLIMAAQQQARVVAHPEFIILVNTELAGSASDTMELPIRGTDMTIDWGDGFIQTGVNQTATPASTNWVTRVYPDGGGIKQIKINGGLNWIRFNATGDNAKLLEIQNWGTTQWATMFSSFHGCANMIGTFTDVPNLMGVENLARMFRVCSIFNSDIGNWDISNIIFLGSGNMGMLELCTMFNNGNSDSIKNWNVSKVENMQFLFRAASSFNQDISKWVINKNTYIANSLLRDSGMSVENYSKLLISWANQVYLNQSPFSVTAGQQNQMKYNNINYTTGQQFNNAVDARNYLINTALWNITDAGQI